MSRQFADNSKRPADDLPSDERSRDLLKEVLSATSDALRPGTKSSVSKYQSVIDRWKGTAWSCETIGKSLVRAALSDWLCAVRLSESAENQLIDDISLALFDDLSAAAKLKDLWEELQESKG